MIGKRFIMLFLLIFLIFYLSLGFTACSGIASAAGVEGTDGVDGTDGTDGQDGLSSPSIYLEDDNGTRYYSGSTVFLGQTNSVTGGGDSITSTFRVINESGTPLSLTGGTGNFIQFDNYELIMRTGSEDIFSSTSSGLGYFSKEDSGLNSDAINPGSQSPDFDFIIEAIENGGLNKFHFSRKYLIPMLLDGHALGFALELNGFISTWQGTDGAVFDW